MAMKYTANDLTVLKDPLEYIQKHPQRFLRSVSGVELATAIAGEACLLTSKPVTLIHREPWWVVAGEADWMEATPGVSVSELFARMVPFPEAGPNSMHGEVLLSAFAADIVTQTPREALVIKGTVSPGEEVWRLVRAHPEWQRVVAFRMDA
jgi:hypothetical protein